MQVEHELAKRALEPRERSFQDHESGAGEFRGGLEIHEAERLAKLEMLLRPKRKLRRRSHRAQNLVGTGVGADRHI